MPMPSPGIVRPRGRRAPCATAVLACLLIVPADDAFGVPVVTASSGAAASVSGSPDPASGSPSPTHDPSKPHDDAPADPSGPTHRYARIPKRNAFGIKPPQAPPPPEPEKEQPKDRPEFFLTGFTTIRGVRRAFVAYQPKGKPLQYPRPLIPDEEVGIADGVLRLVAIDPVEKTVTIAYNGEEIPLNFKDNAVKTTPGGPAPAGAVPAPGAPGLPPGVLRGNQPPPPILNAPSGGVGAVGGVPGGVPGGMAPTVIGRGGAILSGGLGSGMMQNTPMSPNSIPAGGVQVHGGIDVPAVAPAADQLGGTVPVPTTRIRSIPPPPPAPFPGLPGQ